MRQSGSRARVLQVIVGLHQSHDQLEARAPTCIDTPVPLISTGCAHQLPDALRLVYVYAQ